MRVALVALLGLGSRLLPHVLECRRRARHRAAAALSARLLERQRGDVFGIGVALLLWISRRATSAALRWVSVAAIPAVLARPLLHLLARRPARARSSPRAACSPSRATGSGCWQRWRSAALGALPAVLAVQARRSLADNLADQAAVDQGVTVLLDPARRDRAVAAPLRRCCAGWSGAAGALTGRAVRALPQPDAAEGHRALGVAVLADRRRDRGRRPRLGPVLQPRHPVPQQPRAAFRRPLRRRPPRLLAGRDRRLRRKARCSATAPAPTSSPGSEQRSIDLPVHDAHSLYLEAFAELGLVGGLLVLALVGALLWCGFAAWRAAADPQRERYAALLAAMLAFAVGAGFDWFWEIAGLGAVFFLAGGVLVAARCAPARRRSAGGEPPRPRAAASGSPSPGVVAGLDRGDRPGRPAAGRARDRRQPERRRRGRPRRRRRPRRHRPLDRALGGLPLRPARPARRAARATTAAAIEHFTHAIEREDRNWQLYYLRSRVEHEAGDEAAAAGGPRTGRASSTRGAGLPARGMDLRMSAKTSDAASDRRRRRAAATPPRPTERLATGSGLTGPSGSRRRGALLRRLLATGDWMAMLAALCVATAVDLDHRRRRALLGGALQPGLDPGAEAARPLRQRPPPHPPQHARRAALADLRQRPRHDRARRPARAQPGRAALGRRARSSSAIGAVLAGPSSPARCCASSGTD